MRIKRTVAGEGDSASATCQDRPVSFDSCSQASSDTGVEPVIEGESGSSKLALSLISTIAGRGMIEISGVMVMVDHFA